MDYFYTPPEKISGDSVLIDGEEFSHLVHVMRKKSGDEIRVVDGLGTAYDVRLGEIRKKMVRGEISRKFPNHNEPAVAVTIAAGILKNPSKFDFLVEKAVELGVREIVPLRTERTIPSHAKTGRWQKLALAAMKQCGRGVLPKVREAETLDEMLEEGRRFGRVYVAHQQARGTWPGMTGPPDGSVLMLIGPEGGFSDEEIDRCTASGAVPVTFGDRRLRTETAAIVAAAASLIFNSKG